MLDEVTVGATVIVYTPDGVGVAVCVGVVCGVEPAALPPPHPQTPAAKRIPVAAIGHVQRLIFFRSLLQASTTSTKKTATKPGGTRRASGPPSGVVGIQGTAALEPVVVTVTVKLVAAPLATVTLVGTLQVP